MKRFFALLMIALLLFAPAYAIGATGLTLNHESAELVVSKTLKLKASLPDGAKKQTIYWKSADKKIATVSSSGKVTGKKVGSTVISAYTKSGLRADAKITVYAVPKKVSLEKSSATLFVGDAKSCTAKVTPANARDKSLTWKSSNPSVAAVDGSGAVTAKKAGKATITATTVNGKKASLKLTVKEPVTNISLNESKVSLKGGASFTAKASLSPSGATDKKVTWSTSNKKVAVVSGGKITARGKGKCVITAKANGGKDVSASIQVTVTSAPKKVIALTFDDGPNANTLKILKTLDKYNVKATFFVIGQNASRNKNTLKKMHASGHEIANHTWSHPNLLRLSHSNRMSQMSKTDAVIESVTGKKPRLARAPGGSMTKSVAKKMNRTFVYWNIDPQDWKYRNATTVTNHVMSKAGNKKIVLMHDIYASTATAVERIVPRLIAQGYTFVTVSELIEITGGGAKGTIYRP